jgi:hypothetical protein
VHEVLFAERNLGEVVGGGREGGGGSPVDQVFHYHLLASDLAVLSEGLGRCEGGCEDRCESKGRG